MLAVFGKVVPCRKYRMNFSSSTSTEPLVSSNWLKSELKKKDHKLKLLDCTWFMPNTHRPVLEDWKSLRIKGSQYFDIDLISDASLAPLPHMVPSASFFAEKVSELGISNFNHVVCYDYNQYMASARAWWLFRLFGHNAVSVLDGGFVESDWKDAEDLLERTEPTTVPQKGVFKSQIDEGLVKKLPQILDNLQKPSFQIIDARAAPRFRAEVPEPRAGLQGGHIPGAFNVPFNKVFQDNKQLHSVEQLKSVFTEAGVDLGKPIVTSCGSGVTAAVLSLALFKINVNSALYDGSWSEYGQQSLNLPVEPKKN